MSWRSKFWRIVLCFTSHLFGAVIQLNWASCCYQFLSNECHNNLIKKFYHLCAGFQSRNRRHSPHSTSVRHSGSGIARRSTTRQQGLHPAILCGLPEAIQKRKLYEKSGKIHQVYWKADWRVYVWLLWRGVVVCFLLFCSQIRALCIRI